MEYKADKGGNGCKMQLFARNPKESVWVTMGGWISIAVAELDSEIQRYEPMELAPDQLPVKTNLKALMPNAPPAAAKPRTVGPIATK